MPDLSAFTVQEFWAFLQVLARISAMVAIAPVFGAREIPAQIKVGLSLLISLALLPIAQPTLAPAGVPQTFYALVAPIAGQVAIGLILGFVVSLILTAVQMAGAVLDLQIGFSLAQTLNPALGQMVTPISQFQYLYALLLFLLANGHYLLLTALARSFALIPITKIALGSEPFLRFISDITLATLVSAIKIAAPAAGILVVIDLSFAFLSRAVPQMNVFFVGMPIKVMVGLAVLVVVLPLTAYMIGQMVTGSQYDLLSAMRGMRH